MIAFSATIASAQDLSSVFIPEEWTKGCSRINGIFEVEEGQYCVYGRLRCGGGVAFWAIVNTRRQVLNFVEEPEVNVLLEGFMKGDSLIFAGERNDSDVTPYLFSLRIPYHLDGERGRPTRINHIFLADNGLVYDPDSAMEWFVTQYRVCAIRSGIADTVFRTPRGRILQSAEAYNGVLYLAMSDTVWAYREGQPLDFIQYVPNVQNIHIDGSGGMYTLARKWMYYADTIGGNPEVVQNFNEVHLTPYTLNLNSDDQSSDTAVLVYTSVKEDYINEFNAIILERGKPIDTLTMSHPTYLMAGALATADGILSYGSQVAFGSMHKGALLQTDGNVEPSEIDLAIDLQIDSSFWDYDTTPRPSTVKTHKWDYTVTLTNLGRDTVHFGDVYGPSAFSVWWFSFREYCGFDEEIPPGDSIRMQCTGQAHLYDQVVSAQCMAVDAIDTYLDKDYSNNIACAEIPRPIGVGTDDIPITEFSVYPNPGDGLIMHGLDLEDPHDLWVFDVNGKMYRPEHVGQGQIDLSGLPAGVYTILVQTREQTYRASAVIKP
jgi:hypothetical protein